jgi:hypothetical protein
MGWQRKGKKAALIGRESRASGAGLGQPPPNDGIPRRGSAKQDPSHSRKEKGIESVTVISDRGELGIIKQP